MQTFNNIFDEITTAPVHDIGEENLAILVQRARMRQEGLDMSYQVSFERIHLAGVASTRVGPWKQECIPVNNSMCMNFLDAMKQIEEEFMSGLRKRIGG